MQSMRESAVEQAGPPVPQSQPYRKQVSSISIAIQTDFRETAIQTDPWTAPFDEELEKEHSELTSLISLTFANRLLPAHQKTLEVIQELENERDFDSEIPPPLDYMRADFSQKELELEQKRIDMQILKEKRKWDKVEAEMARNDALRLEELIEKLELRSKAREEIRDIELSRIAAKQEGELIENKRKMTNQAITALKMSTLEYKKQIGQVECLADKRTQSDRLIIDRCGAPALTLPQQPLTRNAVYSAVHTANPLNAPILKPGEAPYRFAGVIRLAGTELKTQQDFDEILEYLDDSEDRLTSEFARPKTHKQRKSYAVSSENPLPKILPTPAAALQLTHKRKIEQQIQKQLEKEGGRILQESEQVVMQKQQSYFEEPPSVDNLQEVDAAQFIQNIIRGEATQLRLQAGKNRRIGLVQELRLAHELVTSQNSDLEQRQRLQLLKDNLIAGSIVNASATVIGQSLDAISKNRERAFQIQRARALLEIAMRERERREKLESSIRQKEEMQRCRQDFELKVEVQTHRELVDELLQRIQSRAVSEDAGQRAKQLALKQVEALVELDYETSKAAGRSYQEQLRDVLGNLLLPEVDRRLQLQNKAKDMERLILAGNMARTASMLANQYYQAEEPSFVGRLGMDQVGNLEVRQASGQVDNVRDNQYGKKEEQVKLSRMEAGAQSDQKVWVDSNQQSQ